MMKKSLNLISALLIIFSLFGCSAETGGQNKPQLPQLPVSVKPVVRMDMKDTVTVYGSLHLRQEAKIASQFDGRLEDFNLLPGDHVQKGQRIGTIIPHQRYG